MIEIYGIGLLDILAAAGFVYVMGVFFAALEYGTSVPFAKRYWDLGIPFKLRGYCFCLLSFYALKKLRDDLRQQ